MILSILLPPLTGFLITSFGFKSRKKRFFGWLASIACLCSFTSIVFYILFHGFKNKDFLLWPWFTVGNLTINFSFSLDSLSLLFSLLITGVGFLIHLYSLSYMSKETGFIRYFSYLNLFVFMMLVLVLADNLPLLFVGWEGVGLCSYLLIGFWFKDEKKTKAGMMAFIVNRIGDACFLLGTFILFFHFGTLNFSELNLLFTTKSSSPLPVFLNSGAIGAFLLFLGATGKSAQFPLYFWLPKAMAGPTPVSALIHAATMVTAGVYLIVRLSGFYSAFPGILSVISWIGALTALGAALIATKQWDFKKILAYSTISQLAYLFIALGVQAFSASIFHLLTHGFFKALLFLCAGSVIHALKGEQDIRSMGGLRKSMPITFSTYLIGALALMAFPPFSGFFSKDEILWSLFSSQNYILFSIAFLTGLCTIIYMTKLTVFVFFGKTSFKTAVHESGPLMTFPLILLAFLSLFGGVLGLPHLFSALLPGHPPHILHQLLKSFSPLSFEGSLLSEFLLMLSSTFIGLILLLLTGSYYLKKKTSPQFFNLKFLEEGFFVQKTVQKVIQPSFTRLSSNLFIQIEEAFFFKGIIFLQKELFKIKTIFSFLQNGNVQFYALCFITGLILFVFLIFLR